MNHHSNELKRANKPDELMRTMSPMGLVRSMGLMSPLLLIAFLLVLSSCSKGSDEELTEQPATELPEENPILFTGSMPEPTAVTRAATLSSAGQERFTVWGYKNMSYDEGTGAYSDMQTVFPGYTVNWGSNSAGTTTSNSSNWEYVGQAPNQTIKFWDWSAKAYRFFALTGYTSHEDNAFSIAADARTSEAMAATPYFTHLWLSTGDPVAYPDKQFGQPVVLEFLKPYARVRFIFKYVYPREGIKLTEVSFKPSSGDKIVRKGTVTVSYPLTGTATREAYSMTPDADTSTQLTEFTEDYDPEDDSKVYTATTDGWYMVLPNPTQGSYTMSLKVNGENKTAVVPANYMQWLPGYSYTYIFKVTDEGGVEIGWVESAVTPWTEMETDWTVYNW